MRVDVEEPSATRRVFKIEVPFHEAVTNRILDALAAACRPRFIEVVGDFYIRGGIHTVVTATHGERSEKGRSSPIS